MLGFEIGRFGGLGRKIGSELFEEGCGEILLKIDRFLVRQGFRRAPDLSALGRVGGNSNESATLFRRSCFGVRRQLLALLPPLPAGRPRHTLPPPRSPLVHLLGENNQTCLIWN